MNHGKGFRLARTLDGMDGHKWQAQFDGQNGFAPKTQQIEGKNHMNDNDQHENPKSANDMMLLKTPSSTPLRRERHAVDYGTIVCD
jgi:hypothetical protein